MDRRHSTFLVLALLLSGAGSLAVASDSAPSPVAVDADALATLRPGHPRLLLADQGLARLLALAPGDALLRMGIAEVVTEADRLADAAPLERKLIGPRLLMVSRECLRRTLTLGLAWRLRGDPRHLAAARGNLMTVCAFSDWNPAHFLDVAEMGAAVAIGYDWLYPALSPAERETIRAGIVRHALDAGVLATGGWDGAAKPAWWNDSPSNWNLVCHGGLTVAALAVADTDPRYARTLLARAQAGMPAGLASYEPDGAWPEGPGYWGYATDYTVLALAARDTALGGCAVLAPVPAPAGRQGLERAGQYLLASRGPTGLLPNFADVGDRSRFTGSPTLFWLAEHYHLPALAEAERQQLAERGAKPLDVVWYSPPHAGAVVPAPDLDQRVGGAVELAVFRSAWNDPDALYAYLKGGSNRVGHAHLDLGSFEFDLLGQRWARDLGSDDYDLPGYFNGRFGGLRWAYYRLSSRSHSVPLIDGRNQLEAGTARLTAFSGGDAPRAVVDLSAAYADGATRVQRGLALVDGRSALLVVDELELRAAGTVTWGMTTDAALAVDGTRATLTLGGKSIEARLLQPAGAVFSEESAEQARPQKPNTGVRRLLVSLPAQTGAVRIAVLLGRPGAAVPEVRPLAAW